MTEFMKKMIEQWEAEGRPNKSEFARRNGMNPNTFRKETLGTRSVPNGPTIRSKEYNIPEAQESAASFSEGPEEAMASVTSATVKSLDDLINVCDIDMHLWEVNNHEVKTYQGYRRREVKDIQWNNGRITSGYAKDDGGLELVTMFSVRAWFKRRAAAPYEDALDQLLDRFRTHSREDGYIARKYQEGDHLLVPAMFDVHFGRRDVSGHYRPEQTAREFKAAAEAMIARTLSAGLTVDRILLPIGNDLLNADDLAGRTTRGTWQEMSASQRDIIDAACDSYIDFIEKLLQIAPVDVVMIEGNHDRYSTYMIGKVIEARFSGPQYARSVTVDNTQLPRKYYRYGVNLIGMEHGDQIKPRDLVPIMAIEARQDWAETEYHTFFRGHFHRANEMYHPIIDSDGVSVVVFPAFCPVSSWEMLKGYVGNHRAAEARFFHRDHGPAGQFPVFVDELSDASDNAA